MNRALCRLTTVLPDRARSIPPAGGHLAGCLRCQAAAARRRTIRRGLTALGSEVEAAPLDLTAGVMARLGRQTERSSPRAPAAPAARYATVAGVSAAAATAIALEVLRRHSRLAG